MAFAHDRQPVPCTPEHEVDNASRRWNDDLWLGSPRWANVSRESLEHGRLEAIVEPRTGNRKQPDTKLGAEAGRYGDEDFTARVSLTRFDAPLMSWVDPGAPGEPGHGDTGIESQVRHLAADPRPWLADLSRPISRPAKR